MIAETGTIDVFVVSKEDCSTYYQRKRQYFPDFCTYDVRDGHY